MKVYLDNSFLNRPFDNQEISENRLEAEILFWILDLVKKGEIILVNSAIIEYENSFNPFPERRFFIEETLKLAKVYQNVYEKIFLEAKKIKKQFRVENLDALHLATAKVTKVDLFITCDYNLIRKFKDELKVISPLEFLRKYEKHNY